MNLITIYCPGNLEMNNFFEALVKEPKSCLTSHLINLFYFIEGLQNLPFYKENEVSKYSNFYEKRFYYINLYKKQKLIFALSIYLCDNFENELFEKNQFEYFCNLFEKFEWNLYE